MAVVTESKAEKQPVKIARDASERVGEVAALMGGWSKGDTIGRMVLSRTPEDWAQHFTQRLPGSRDAATSHEPVCNPSGKAVEAAPGNGELAGAAYEDKPPVGGEVDTEA